MTVLEKREPPWRGRHDPAAHIELTDTVGSRWATPGERESALHGADRRAMLRSWSWTPHSARTSCSRNVDLEAAATLRIRATALAFQRRSADRTGGKCPLGVRCLWMAVAAGLLKKVKAQSLEVGEVDCEHIFELIEAEL